MSTEENAINPSDVLDRAADALLAAEREARPIQPLTTQHPGLTAADAYAIQERVVARRVAAGERVLGWKLGLTSRAMQEQLGVDQPDYAAILSGWVIPDGAAVEVGSLIAPRIEAEIAVILDRPLRGPGVTREEARAAIGGIAPAMEIIDSRIADWKIGLADTIADLASCARILVGTPVPLGDIDPRLIGCVLERDREVVATGAGAAALGDPVVALAWAANTLGDLGVTLEARQVIMTGAIHASVPVRAGDTFRARFDRLGSVTVRFS